MSLLDMPPLAFLLVGPYDPHSGEYTFLSPPLGVWRLTGALRASGYHAEVFDPNILDDPSSALIEKARSRKWDVIGFSLTGMTLPFDLSLAHAVRPCTDAVLVAGGMEATFNPDVTLDVGPYDLVVLGEGEKPLRALAQAIAEARPITGLAGTAFRDPTNGTVQRRPQVALDRDELSSAIQAIPYDDMPYREYWQRLQTAYRVGSLPVKAEREARLAEIRSVRLATLNYCPMGCTFCSSTNFLHAAQASTARIARLDADECLDMVTRITQTYPDVRTIIFQDDIFVFTQDDRVLPLCEGILSAKEAGTIPRELEFISTNRIDSMTDERLGLMTRAGFRVLGFGVESFSQNVLREFNKERIYPYIAPVLAKALALGVTPFLDMILASPRSTISDLVTTLRNAQRWMEAGCEVGMYPYVIPFSGAAMASDPAHESVKHYERCTIPGTNVSWTRATKILPHDDELRHTVVELERTFDELLAIVTDEIRHVPSRLRSWLWILSASTVLDETHGLSSPLSLISALMRHAPVRGDAAARVQRRLVAASTRAAVA